jgi:hypothetical protein
MKILKYIARNISVLNLILLCITVMIFVYGISPLLSAKIRYKTKPSPNQSVSQAKDQSTVLPSAMDYNVIAEANLFHPDRKLPAEKKDEKAIPRPELILYGTLVTGDLAIAYVEDKKAPYSTPGRGKRPNVLKKGESIGGFILKEVTATQITLVRNEEIMTVNIDTAKDRSGAPPKTQAPATAVAQPIQRSAPSPLLAPGSAPAGPRSGAIPTTPANQPPQRDLRNPPLR